MLHAQLLDRVRERVKSAFASQGIGSWDDWAETILIREGFYCGRCFLCGGLRAVWFVEENTVKFFGRDNTLLFAETAADDGSRADQLVA